ncbi:MAG: c-type cytochrome domain-containing protein, partial [Singulisphaera sp.]
CFHCHGPDKAKRKGDLRLDSEAGARAVIVAGDLEASEVYHRITSPDGSERMPPPDSGRSLTPGQVTLIRRWIEQGATWGAHWSLVPPGRPIPPAAPHGTPPGRGTPSMPSSWRGSIGKGSLPPPTRTRPP